MKGEIEKVYKILKTTVNIEIDLRNYLSIAVERPIKAVIPNTYLNISHKTLYRIFDILGIKTNYITNAEVPYLTTDSEDIGRIPIYKYGLYYIMELASVLPLYIWRDTINKEKIILDIAAAPGGKTYLLSNIFREGVVVANEPNRVRLRRLRNNIQKYLLPNVVITQYKGEKFPKNLVFDIILFDAPCSGINLIYKRRREVLSNLRRSREYGDLQKKIISNIYDLLVDGGELLYITCTLSKYECEEVVKHAIKSGFEAIEISKKLPFNTIKPEDRDYPELSKTHYILPTLNKEKFSGNIGTAYVALLRKSGS